MATVYLAPTGSDAYTYVQAQNPATPWLTPGKVNTSATTGDTVSMAAGTYTWASVTFSKSFIWVGAVLSSGLPTTILDGAAAHVSWALAAGATNTFTNILFQNVVQTSAVSVIALPTTGVNIVTFTSCCFRNIALYDNNASSTGLFGQAEATPTTTFTVSSCLIYGITKASAASYGRIAGLRNYGAILMSAIFINTVIYHSASGATALTELFASNSFNIGMTIKNCIFFSVNSLAFRYSLGLTNFLGSYSCNYNLTSIPTFTYSITSDPLFVDAANANFNLRPTSPCIDTGSL
jgi:hypothetical protein